MQHPALNQQLASALTADWLEQAERLRRSRVEWTRIGDDSFDSVTVRSARPDDARALERLAELDGRHAPEGSVLVAEVEGELLAARSLANGTSVANPFRHTAHLLELLELRSAHLRERSNGRPVRLPRGRALIRALTAHARS